MSAAWWIHRGTEVNGPFTVDQLKRMASEGNLDRKVPIRLGKTTAWVEAQQMDWLREYFESTSQKVTPEPAVPYEAPQVTEYTLRGEFKGRREERTTRPPSLPTSSEDLGIPDRRPDRGILLSVINVVGFVIFSALGLVIGYYVLCLINPEANFLN